MKQSIIILFLLLSTIFYPQEKSIALQNEQRLKELTTQIKSLNSSLEKIKEDDASLYNLKKDIINDKLNYQKIEQQIDKAYNGWVSDILTFWTFIGVVIGVIAVIVSWKEKIKNEVNKRVVEQISVANNISKEIVERLYTTEEENALIRKEAKVLLINEKNTNIDSWIRKVFISGSKHSEFDTTQKSISNFKDIEEYSEYSLVVIDNAVSNNRTWLSFTENTDKTKLNDKGKELVSFCKHLLSKKISVLYFSESIHFPNSTPEFQELENKGLLAYGNAHSKIYPNTMDVLKNRKLA